MEIARTIIQIVFIILSIIMTVIVLMQEGKNNGLGALTGSADTYWSKNKGRSMEGALEHFTRYGAIVFMILTLVLNFPYHFRSTDNWTFSVRIPKRLSLSTAFYFVFALFRKRYGNVFSGDRKL